MTDYKMVDGISLPLTDEEQIEHDDRIAKWEEANKQPVAVTIDLATQIATIYSALIDKGIITTDDIPSDVVSVISTKVASLNTSSVSLQR